MLSYVASMRPRNSDQKDVKKFKIKVHPAGDIPWMSKITSTWELVEADTEDMSKVFISIQGEEVETTEAFRNIDINLRKCKFSDEGDLKIFSYYSESNCELECAWEKAEEICGCRPWFVPALDTSTTCFILGNVCFDQTMKKIEKKKLIPKCQCDKDCRHTAYSISMDDKVVLERLSPKLLEYSYYGIFNDPEYSTIGTEVLDGLNFDETYWYNMGKRKFTSAQLPNESIYRVLKSS